MTLARNGTVPALVDDAKRFRITYAGDGRTDWWRAVDLAAPEGDAGAVFTGLYMDCLAWCWGRS